MHCQMHVFDGPYFVSVIDEDSALQTDRRLFVESVAGCLP